MFHWFEKLLDPYPVEEPQVAPRGFFAFVWAGTAGARPYIAAMTALTAVTGVFEALLFAMMGHIVDWLAKVEPAQLWARASAAACCCWPAC